jgi:hypothetical protein
MSEPIVFYSNHANALVGTMRRKVLAILRQGAIEYVKADPATGAHGYFLVHPIKNEDGTNYNVTTYKIVSIRGVFSCECQGFTTKEAKYKLDPIANPPPNCSHVSALHEHLKRKHLERQEIMTISAAAKPTEG